MLPFAAILDLGRKRCIDLKLGGNFSMAIYRTRIPLSSSLYLFQQISFNQKSKLVREFNVLKEGGLGMVPGESLSRKETITAWRKQLDDAQSKFLHAKTKTDKKFWLVCVTRLIKELELYEEEVLCLEKLQEKKWLTDPRSMFGPIGTIPPSPRKYALPASIANSTGVFVNRNKQLAKLWESWIETWKSGPIPKAILVSTGQMFGSGKTTFGLNALNLENEHIREAFKSLPSCDGKDALMNTLTVHIDLQQLNIPDFVTNLSEAVSWLMWQCTLEQYYDIKPVEREDFWKVNKIGNPRACLERLTNLTGKNLYFHFDEVNIIEDVDYDRFFPTSTLRKYKNDEVLGRYYLFWRELGMILKDAFVYVSGRSVKLSELSIVKFGLGVNPCRSVQLFLPRFEISDIKDIVRPKYMASFGLLSESDLSLVATQLFKWTSGIPRPLEYALKYLCTMSEPADFLRIHAKAEEAVKIAIDRVAEERLRSSDSASDARYAEAELKKAIETLSWLDAEVWNYMLINCPSIVAAVGVVNGSMKKYLPSVINAAACELSFHQHDFFPGTHLRATDISEVFSIYTTPSSSDPFVIQFILPRFWLYYMHYRADSSNEIFEALISSCSNTAIDCSRIYKV